MREICDQINEGGPGLAYTTVLSLLQVMEQKGLVGHRRAGRAYVHFARVEREATFRGLAGGFLERVFDGAVDEYLVHALQSRRHQSRGTRPAGEDDCRGQNRDQTTAREKVTV